MCKIAKLDPDLFTLEKLKKCQTSWTDQQPYFLVSPVKNNMNEYKEGISIM